MTVDIPADLEKAMQQRSMQYGLSVEQLVREALEWYLQTDAELLDELEAWQEVRDEAADIVEESAPRNEQKTVDYGRSR